MKEWICTAIGVAGSFIASLFGGWDAALATLVIFMAIDRAPTPGPSSTSAPWAACSITAARLRMVRLRAVQVGKGCAVRVFPFWWFWLPAAWI
mgnify:CR=1 FL=1